eukprot:1662964-Amphidinium_carterae.1
MGKRVSEAIDHESYWGWLCIVDAVSSFCHVHRQWCLACNCHELECQQFASKSQVYPCAMKSMRAPRLHQHLEAAKHALREQMQNLAASPAFESQPHLRTHIRDATETLLSSLALKFSFTAAMPWLIWRVRSEPHLATHILNDYDQKLEQGHVIHRLHTRLGKGKLGALASGAPLSDELDAALLPYEVARLDGAAAEGVHRNVQLSINRASASRFCYWSAHLRLKQNISVWEALKRNGDPVALQRFLAFFAQPSRLQAKVWTYPALPKPAKMKRQTLLAKHYRLWPNNMVDFAWLLPKKESCPSIRSLLSDVTYCHYELFKWMFQVGCIFSHVTAGDQASDNAFLLAHTEVFQVVMGDVSQKRVQHSTTADMVLPIFIQRCMVVPDQSELNVSLCIRRDIEQELVDGASLITPNAVLHRLYRWKHCDSHIDGTNLDMLSDPVQVSQDLPAEGKPVFFIILELRKVHKWGSSDDSPIVHTADTPKSFKASGFSKRRWYLNCLISLPSILARLGGLRTDQHERYYECVYAGLSPPLNKRVKDYDQLLSGVGVVSQPLLPDSGDLGNAWEESFFGEEVLEALAVEEEADDGPAELEEATADVGAEAEIPVVPDIPANIDGLQLFQDNHGGYRRLLIVCPQTHGRHKAGNQCRKYRNIGLAQMATLGTPHEVAAYLGAWARLAHVCSDRNCHVSRNPTKEEMLAVARENGWAT